MMKGKTAIVTGASRGIGEAIAGVLMREGAAVFICGRKAETLEEAAGRLNGLGHSGQAIPVVAHVGKAADLEALVGRAKAHNGRLDVLVNNAATNIAQGPCLEFGEVQFDKMIETNVKSAWRLTQAIAPVMVAQGSGSIINISSVAGLRPQPQSLLYSMTKAALIMMTQSYALELGPSGVRVNAIAPGLIQTQLSEFYWKDDARRDRFLGNQPMRHLGQPIEIAEIALMLASGKSSYVTGQTIIVDGGYLLT
ncbi:MAG: SDR family oxidoreductase [Bryobacteraceae bacterium]|nr:SDR family oxidoreductase [Bryobacteraceae bacterium]